MKKTTTPATCKSFLGSRLFRFSFLAILFLKLFSSSVYAQNTFTAASGNWNTAANWSLGHVPNGTENLVIPAGNTCTMDVNYTGSNTFSITISGTLQVPSGITLDQSKSTIIMAAGGATLSGGGTVYLYTFNVATATVTDVVNITNSSVTPISIGKGNTAGILNLTQGLLKLNGQTLNIAKTATINATGGNLANGADGAGDVDADGGTISMIGSSGGTTTVNGAVTFYNINSGFGNGFGNVTLALSTASGVNSRVNGTFAVSGSTANQYHASGNPVIWGPSSTLYIDGGGQSGSNSSNYLPSLWTTSGTIGVTPGYPNNVTITHMGTSAGNNYGWILTGSWSLAGVLTIGDPGGASTGQINFSGVTNFSCGGFVLTSGSRFAAPAAMAVNGSWTNNQATGANLGFVNNNGTVTFGGASQQIGGTAITPFYNLVINDAAGAVATLGQPVTLPAAGTLTLTSGNIQSSLVNLLSITNTSTAAISGGNSSSFIDGPVQWSLLSSGSNIYNFPVGAGSTYLPFTINVNNTASGNAATVQAFATGSGGTVDGTLSSLSTTEYWSLLTTSPLAAGSSVSVSRPTAIAPLSLLAESNTSATGVYTSIGGTPVANGINNSNDIGTTSPWFISLGNPPIVSTLAATSITTTGATLNGAFNTMGTSLPTSFSYGTNTSSGLGTVVTIQSPINSNSSFHDSAIITGLTANTLYTYVATDGVNSGSDVTFITSPNAPVIGTPSSPYGSGFTANWSAPAAMGSASYTYTIQVSSDPTFATGVTTQTGVPSASTSSVITGLTSATTYYYRVQAVNATASSAWSAVSTGITTDLVPTPPCNNNTSNDGATTFTNTAPVIDGTIDPVWTNAPSNPINVVTLGNNNNTQSWQSLWTADSLYLLVQVTDASLIGQATGLQGTTSVPGVTSNNSANYYEADGIEFYLDPDHSNTGNYDGVNDVQLRFNLGSNTISGQSAGGAAQFVGAAFQRDAPLIDWKMVVTSTGYLLEAAIPWGKDAAHPGVFLLPNPPNPANTYGTPTSGQTIGIDVNVNDQDAVGAGRQAQIQWFNSSTDAYLHPNVFSNAGLQVCPEPPVVVSPTKANITSTSADLGATVVSSGKDPQLNPSPLASRGTAYSTSVPVVSNAAAEGGTQLGIYSATRTGLAPQTKYYYLGYANNQGGLTGVSTVDSFFTLSEIPTVQPTLSAASCSQITLNWTAVTFPPVAQASQTGYIILRRQDGSNPTTAGISTRVATAQSALPAGTTLVATINSGSTLTYVDATGQAGTTYNYLLVPFTWDGVAADSTYNYFTTGAATTSTSIGSSATPTFDPVAAICSGATLNALPTTSNNGITGTWSPALNNTATTTYTFTPAAGQCATTATLIITVNSGTTPTFDPVAAICSGATLNALPTTSNNGITGTWTPALNNTSTTTYTFTPAAGQCASTATQTINVSPVPVVTASADQLTVSSGSTVTLTGTSTVAGNYSWTALPDGSISSPGSLQTTAQPTQTTAYTLTVTGQGNCQGSNSVTVTVKDNEPCPLTPAKAFTPNGDGVNELWVVFRGDCVTNIQVNVYNRWGGLVFHSDDYHNDWNGNYKNNRLADGTYYYVIKATSASDNITRTYRGNVTIIR